jgi:amino acid adenylation domain-containing protein
VNQDRTLYQWFADTVARVPDAPAVQVEGRTLDYRELHARALGLAEAVLAEHGSAPGSMAVLAARTEVAFVGYLAALRLGAAVTPLNPGYPAERNREVCRLAGVQVLVADHTGARQVDELLRELVPTVLVPGELEPGTGAGLPEYRTALDDVAYVLFTSGSTGRPKGVPVRHRNLSPYVAFNIERYQVGPGARMSHTFDATFDPSVFDMFVTWGGGATLVAPQRNELMTPVDYVAQEGITHWFSVPSVVSVSAGLGNLPTGLITSLRYSVFIGEQLTANQARAWRSVAPSATIENVYGPTELTVACTVYQLPAEPASWPMTSNDTVPIGPVYEFLDWVVLDEHGRRTDDGELCVRGAQRFDGYLDPADNAGRFLSHEDGRTEVYDGTGPLTGRHYYRTGDRIRLEHGQWVHLGRLDNQVKVRGYRVELGEIEAAMRKHDDVLDAVVVTERTDDDDTELIGFYTGAPVASTAFLLWLRKRIPVHMVPRRYRHLEAMPLNANGKVDRGVLRDLLAEPTTV